MIPSIGDCAQRKLTLAQSSSAIPNRKVRCWKSLIYTNGWQRVPRSEWEKLRSGRQLRQSGAVVPLAENDGFDFGYEGHGPSTVSDSPVHQRRGASPALSQILHQMMKENGASLPKPRRNAPFRPTTAGLFFGWVW
jgi:hypothetical protein